jgi:hypothetical protein
MMQRQDPWTTKARQEAAEATLNAFIGKPMVWGSADCVRLAAFNLRHMGRPPPLRKGGAYKTEAGARAALKRAGYADLAEALDGIGLERVPFAYHMMGDIVALPGRGGWHALNVAVGNNKLLGFADDGICRAGEPRLQALFDAGHELITWRATPCPR